MFYYNYDTKKCILLNEITEEEITDTSVKSEEQFNLSICDVYVAILSRDRKIMKYTSFLKPDVEVIRYLNQLSEQQVETDTILADILGGATV